MEGRGVRVPLGVVLVVVLILGLNLAQTHVEAKSCCPTTTARNCYNICRLPDTPRETCAKLCGCTIVPDGTQCPSNYPKHFCMLGCASSMCSANVSTLQNDMLDVAKEAQEGCNNICSELCNEVFVNGSNAAVFTA